MSDVNKTQAEIIAQGQTKLLNALEGIVDSVTKELGDEAGKGAERAIGETLQVLDGRNGEYGYFVIPKEDDLRLMPSSIEAWEQCNTSIPFMVGLDLAGELHDLFSKVND